MNKRVEQGSRWVGNNGDYFRVLDVVDLEGHTWVHYRQDQGHFGPIEGLREYSCYQESFVERFRQVPNDRPKP
jgi:hypothetical protein